jgi:hypothetical protein
MCEWKNCKTGYFLGFARFVSLREGSFLSSISGLVPLVSANPPFETMTEIERVGAVARKSRFATPREMPEMEGEKQKAEILKAEIHMRKSVRYQWDPSGVLFAGGGECRKMTHTVFSGGIVRPVAHGWSGVKAVEDDLSPSSGGNMERRGVQSEIINTLTRIAEIAESRMDGGVEDTEHEGVTSDEKTNLAGWSAEGGGSTYRRTGGRRPSFVRALRRAGAVGNEFGGASGESRGCRLGSRRYGRFGPSSVADYCGGWKTCATTVGEADGGGQGEG